MTNAQTIKTTLTSAATLLNTKVAALESKILLQHALNVNGAWLIAHENDALQAISMRCLSDGHTLIFDTQFLNFPR